MYNLAALIYEIFGVKANRTVVSLGMGVPVGQSLLNLFDDIPQGNKIAQMGHPMPALQKSAAEISSIFVSIVSKNTLKVSPGLPLFKCLRSATSFGSSPIIAYLARSSPVSSVHILRRTCFGTVTPWIFDTLWLKVQRICLAWNTSNVSISLNMQAPTVNNSS